MSERDPNLDFEKRTKALFDHSAAALDAAARSRLTRSRHRALAARAPRRPSLTPVLVPVGVAAAAVMAWLLVPLLEAPPVEDPSLQLATLGDLEILLGEEDLEMLDEELEFYGWLEEQPEFVFVDADDSVG
jgi:hypothetical protein